MRFPCTFQCAQPDGALVLYLGAADDDESGATATRVVRVAPVGGRLVLFDARSILHAVEPHRRADEDRLALTVWFGGAFCSWCKRYVDVGSS